MYYHGVKGEEMFYPGVVGKGMFYPGEVIEGMFYSWEIGSKYSTGFDTNTRRRRESTKNWEGPTTVQDLVDCWSTTVLNFNYKN